MRFDRGEFQRLPPVSFQRHAERLVDAPLSFAFDHFLVVAPDRCVGPIDFGQAGM